MSTACVETVAAEKSHKKVETHLDFNHTINVNLTTARVETLAAEKSHKKVETHSTQLCVIIKIYHTL